jgi:two-component system chemotaxis sensor kinase CheA
MIEELAHELDKKVEFVLVGKDVTLPSGKLAPLEVAIVHLVRNCIDHAIEDVPNRLAQGKEAAGKIRITCEERPGWVVLTVQDDGRGIDPEVIAKRALDKGIVTETQLATFATTDKLDLIFVPGFSTKDRATEISGRGVGMDIVKSSVENMGGYIKVSSDVGRGTKFEIHIQVPAFTLATPKSA